MFLLVYRTVPAEGIQPGLLIEIDGDPLEVEEVRLTIDGVEIGGKAPGSTSTRRSWAKLKRGDHVKALADEEQVHRVVRELAEAIGYARSDWEDRHANDDTNMTPPWLDAGHLEVRANGYWFSIEPFTPDAEPVGPVPEAPDPDQDG